MNPVYAFKDTSKSFPPEDVDYVKVDFKETGSRFAEYCRHLARLQPGDRILDVDCGLGAACRRPYRLSRFDRAL